MNVLVLTHKVPFPIEDGQSLRIFHYVRRLAARHRFSLVAFGEGPSPEPLRGMFPYIRTVPRRPMSREPVSMRKLARAFRPSQFLEYDPAMAALITQAVTEVQPDVVWICGWDLTAYLPLIPEHSTVADLVDEAFVEYWRELMRPRSLVSIPFCLRELVMNVLWERACARRASVSVVVSEVDARWLRRFSGRATVEVLENGVDEDYFQPQGLAEDAPPSLVFEGNLGFLPNVDAASWMARDIFPRIQAAVPDVRLHLVGRNPAPAVQQLAGGPITVTGRVPDVRPYLDRAAVFVCPMRKGAGIKNKLLQAWSMAKPVVATPVACGGLRTRPGEDIVVARGAAQFAAEVVRLLGQPARRRQLGAQARETILGHYTWALQAAAFERTLRHVATTARRLPATATR